MKKEIYTGAVVSSNFCKNSSEINFDFASMYPNVFNLDGKTLKEFEQKMFEKEMIDKLDTLGL